MLKLSANLGFLWRDLALPDAIRAAGAAGFDAVECHVPYAFPAQDVRAALDETQLEMVSLNTRMGGYLSGVGDDLGEAAVPGREDAARRELDEAIEYAEAIRCRAVSVIAGRTSRTDEAEATFRSNLTYAAEAADPLGITILIEPLNTNVCEDYHLVSADRGVETIAAVGAPNLKLMVDYYHLFVMEAEPREVLERAVPVMGHFQFASIPDRSEPDGGNVDFGQLLAWLMTQGYDGYFGAEYIPAGPVEAGLGWMNTIRKANT